MSKNKRERESKRESKNENKKTIKIIKNGKEINESKKSEYEKISKKNVMYLYIIPLVLLIIIGIAYVLIQNNFLLVFFAIFMFIILWGWDGSSRTCPNCKKWNSVVWIKNEKRVRKTQITKRNFLKKETTKIMKEKYLKVTGKCKNCDCEYETEKNIMF